MYVYTCFLQLRRPHLREIKLMLVGICEGHCLIAYVYIGKSSSAFVWTLP